jgi:hypothetical protein
MEKVAQHGAWTIARKGADGALLHVQRFMPDVEFELREDDLADLIAALSEAQAALGLPDVPATKASPGRAAR